MPLTQLPKITVTNSDISGLGVFAAENIPSGVKVIEYTGEKIDSQEADRREEENDLTGKTYIFILDEEYSLDGAVGGNDSKYINHSCNPNLRVFINRGHIYLYSKRPIKKGEELTYDYSFEYDPDNPTPCHCGSLKCRGTINELP